MKNLKATKTGIIICLFITAASCATLSKHFLVRFQERIYEPCQAPDVKEPIGKLCFRYCVKYKFLSKECKTWKVDVRNFSDEKDFNSFKDAGFIMVNGKKL